MTAVLLDSKRVGSGGWIYLREDRGVIRFNGLLGGDLLSVDFYPAGKELSVDEDGTFPIPEGTERLKVHHLEAAIREVGGVNVDLVRTNGYPNT